MGSFYLGWEVDGKWGHGWFGVVIDVGLEGLMGV